MPILCVYCGEREGTTDDHVIPKSYFANPKPNDLLTVKCCPACQQKYKKDEDLLRMWLNLGPAGGSKIGKYLWEQKLRRAIAKDKGLRNILARSMGPVDIHTLSGIYLGKKVAVRMERGRVHNVIKKIIQGLFWFEYEERLPQDILIEIADIPGSGQQIEEIISVTQEPKRSWDKIFEYRHIRPDRNIFESMWIISIYRHYYFLIFIDFQESTPRDKALFLPCHGD